MKVTTKKIVELSEQEVKSAIVDYVEKHQQFQPRNIVFNIAVVPYDETGIHQLIGARAE